MRSACLILQETNMRYVITSQSASGGAACIPVRFCFFIFFFYPVRKHRVRVHPRLNTPYKGVSYLSNRDIRTQKPECYFGSPMRWFFFFPFPKIGSRAQELNAMSAAAQAIHGPSMNVFTAKWRIKCNCLSSWVQTGPLFTAKRWEFNEVLTAGWFLADGRVDRERRHRGDRSCVGNVEGKKKKGLAPLHWKLYAALSVLRRNLSKNRRLMHILAFDFQAAVVSVNNHGSLFLAAHLSLQELTVSQLPQIGLS